MGLIEFFKNLFKTPTPSRFEDLYNFDFPVLLEKATFIGEYVNPYDDNKTILFDYECTLDPLFLDAFDTLIMRLRSKDIGIEPDRHITIILKSKNRTLSNPQISVVVDAVCEAWKKDPAANPELASVYMFKDGRVAYLSFDDDSSIIAMRNDVQGGLTVEFQMIYEDMKQLGQGNKN